VQILFRAFGSSLITLRLSAVGQTLYMGPFLIAASGAVLHGAGCSTRESATAVLAERSVQGVGDYSRHSCIADAATLVHKCVHLVGYDLPSQILVAAGFATFIARRDAWAVRVQSAKAQQLTRGKLHD
jgi:hypothetical protein